jgi:hypothetical protein
VKLKKINYNVFYGKYSDIIIELPQTLKLDYLCSKSVDY